MATTRFYRCDYCGVVFNGGRKSDWFYNEDDIWCHRCKGGHVGGRKLMGPNAIVLSSDESQQVSDSEPSKSDKSLSEADELAEQLKKVLGAAGAPQAAKGA